MLTGAARDPFLVDRVALGARAVAARLRAVTLLARRPLPEVLRALTPATYLGVDLLP